MQGKPDGFSYGNVCQDPVLKALEHNAEPCKWQASVEPFLVLWGCRTSIDSLAHAYLQQNLCSCVLQEMLALWCSGSHLVFKALFLFKSIPVANFCVYTSLLFEGHLSKAVLCCRFRPVRFIV